MIRVKSAQKTTTKKVRLTSRVRSKRFGAPQDVGAEAGLGFEGGNLLTDENGRGGCRTARANLPTRASEHSIFIRCRSAPRAAERPFKFFRSGEHVLHAGHPGHVPLRDVDVKRCRGGEHAEHGGHP